MKRAICSLLRRLPILALACVPFSAGAAERIYPFKPVVVYFLTQEGKENAFVKSAIAGVKRAERELGIACATERVALEKDSERALAAQAKQGYSPVIAVGNHNVPAVQNLAKRFPDTRFVVVDGLVPPLYPNVQSVAFRDHEGAFLAGYIAAYSSRNHHVGFIGGVDAPIIRNFALGYRQGALYANPATRIEEAMVGKDASAWSRPDHAFDLARAQYEKGADIIFAAAGGSGVGVLRAAHTYDRRAIGADTNQNGLYPGYVLTSMVKRVDVAVFEALRAAKEGEWQAGVRMLGIKEGALDYAVDNYNKDMLDSKLVDKVANVKERIVNGIITVESYSSAR